MTWRYVPMKTSTFSNGKFYTNVPVTQIVIHPEGSHPGTRAGFVPVEIKTAHGSRWQGFKRACIDASLRVAVDTTGRERDEVVAKWKRAPKNPCGGVGGARGKKVCRLKSGRCR